jgi:DNA polymerase I
MIRISDELAGEEVRFHLAQSKEDLHEVARFILNNPWLACDTESTGVNCYKRGWKLRTAQWGNRSNAYVVPASNRSFIGWVFRQGNKLIGHNGPHDIRSIDVHLGYETGRVMEGETHIPAHHSDSRGRDEGGTGHGLKELAVAHVDRNSDKWEKALKAAFKDIQIPIKGEIFKSGPRKGMQKTRKAKVSEGYSLIPLEHPAYIAYAASDCCLTYRVWQKYQPVVREFHELYKFDKRVQQACDKLQRRAMLADVDYTTRLSEAYAKKAYKLRAIAWEYGCENIQSGTQIADTLIELGVKLFAKTDTGKWKTDAELLRKIAKRKNVSQDAKHFIRTVLAAKQIEKRREAYTEHILDERDWDDCVHPSINHLAARTTRMSVSGPAVQQLPTKDTEEDLT